MTDLPPAGPEMDALVAEATGLPTFFFSRRLNDAMGGFEEWCDLHPEWRNELTFDPSDPFPGMWEVTLIDRRPPVGKFRYYTATSDSLAYAICCAIVQAYQATKEAQG